MNNLFLSHINNGKGKSILLVGNGKDLNYAKNLILENNIQIPFDIVNTDTTSINSTEKKYDLAIIVDRKIGAARKNHFACTKLKQQGSVVVFGLCRGLFFGSPKSAVGNLTYGGMFALAGSYLKTVRPKGDYLEFGVFDGRTLTLAYHTLSSAVNRFFAFDSFEGIIGTLDSENSHFEDGAYFSNKATFWHNMKVANVNEKKIAAIQADFVTSLTPEILEQQDIQHVSAVHIDCDVYLPAKKALDFITDVISDGALLLFDDYDQLAANPNKGERRALKEWLEENPHISVEEYRPYSIFCRSFIVHKQQSIQ